MTTIRDRIKEFRRVPASQLLANPKNWRKHPEKQRAAMSAVLEEIGFAGALLAREREDGQLVLIDGHLRTETATGQDVPVLVLDVTEAESDKILATLDPLAGMAEVDEKILADLVDGIQFEAAEFGDFLQTLRPKTQTSGLTDEDAVPDPPKEPITKPGDMWILGSHRLLCGDCRDVEDVRHVMAGQVINLAFTWPPYASQRDYDETSGFRPIPEVQYVEWFEAVAFNVACYLVPDGSWFVNIKPSCGGLDTSLYVHDLVAAHVRKWGWHFATEFCWERNGVPKSVTQRFKNQFEPIYQFVKARWKMRPENVRHYSENVPVAGGHGSGETSWASTQGGRGATSVSGSFGAAKKRRNGTRKLISDVQGNSKDAGEYIRPGLAFPGNRLPTFASSHQATGHTAAFPVGLPDFFIRAFTDQDDVIFDPFMGSGSTLVAAEKNGRRALGIEISPLYVDVAVERWQQFTGKKATLEANRAG